MKKVLIIAIVLNSLLYALNTENRKTIADKQLQLAIDKEKEHAKEQTFHQRKSYDFKSAEVNPASLSSIPDIEADDFDMDDVY